MYLLCFINILSYYNLMIMILLLLLNLMHWCYTSTRRRWPVRVPMSERECYNSKCVAVVVIPGWPVVTTYTYFDLTQIVYTYTHSILLYNATLSTAVVNNIIMSSCVGTSSESKFLSCYNIFSDLSRFLPPLSSSSL